MEDELLVIADGVSVFTLEVGILMFGENFCSGAGFDYLLPTTLGSGSLGTVCTDGEESVAWTPYLDVTNFSDTIFLFSDLHDIYPHYANRNSITLHNGK